MVTTAYRSTRLAATSHMPNGQGRCHCCGTYTATGALDFEETGLELHTCFDCLSEVRRALKALYRRMLKEKPRVSRCPEDP